MAAVRDVDLPADFAPAITDVVFIRSEAGIEVYMSSSNRYEGASPEWSEIAGRPESPGRSRLVTTGTTTDAAIDSFVSLLVGAGRGATTRHGVEALTEIDTALCAFAHPRVSTPDAATIFAALAERIRGQDQAVRTLAALVARHLARTHPSRPATAFALGPTGVGKTLAAESLPDALRSAGSGDYGWLRVDLSEYSEAHRVSQLLGAPQGYVGYGDGAGLTDALAANPKTIVLFDEFDKAHSLVQRTLMNAMDAGRLSRPHGAHGQRDLDCRSAIFLFTSNLDATEVLAELGTDESWDKSAVVDAVCRARLRAAGMPAELLGRVGAFLVFRPLDDRARAEILAMAIVRVAAEYGLRVEHVDPETVAFLLREAADYDFGARPCERLVDVLFADAFTDAKTWANGQALAIGGPPLACMALQASAIAPDDVAAPQVA